MNIDTSGIGSYYRISRSLEHLPSGQKAEAEKINTSTIKTEDEFKSLEPEKSNSSEGSSSDKIELTSSMSKYLSPEEKEMLNALFPPPGRDVGIRAYKRGQEPVGNEVVLGQKVDVRT